MAYGCASAINSPATFLKLMVTAIVLLAIAGVRHRRARRSSGQLHLPHDVAILLVASAEHLAAATIALLPPSPRNTRVLVISGDARPGFQSFGRFRRLIAW
jgi:hypothetical protein